MWTERARSWRRNKKRAVSPIIATILLVAITVVLAAVLYILISGLTKGPGNTPVGTAFAFGQAQEQTGAVSGGPTGCSATAAEVCYTIPVGAASSGFTANDLNFQIKSASGIIGSIKSVSVLDVNGNIQAFYTGGAFGSATCAGTMAYPGAACGGTFQVTTSDTLVLDTGAATSVSGDTLVAIGTGSYSGQVATTLP
ncbi:MAG: archaellin/type IV pilin N-terminal domain-containing protein [Thermoplasmata archaeon]